MVKVVFLTALPNVCFLFSLTFVMCFKGRLLPGDRIKMFYDVSKYLRF